MDFAAILIDIVGHEEERENERERMRENAILMKNLRDTVEPFDLTDEQFVKVFRLSKEVVHFLCNVLQHSPSLQRTRTNNGLSVQTQILAALRFFAIGSYQRGIGNDYLVSLSQPATSRATRAVAVGISEMLANEWIKFPTTEERRATLKRRFQEERNFKGVIGCIDCTHIAIVKPSNHEEAYANHKGFHSINVQAVASHDLEILSINARFPGTVHDSFIWRHSAVRHEMIRLYDSGDRSTWLLGDAGYSLEPWLMTPITNAPEGSPEARYTQCHTSTRNCVERMFGVLKNVFRCLLSHRVLHYKPVMASNITIACAVLHNMRLRYNLMDQAIDIDEEAEAEAMQRVRLRNNLLARNRIRVQVEEIIGAENLNAGDRLTEARRIQKRILRTQFGLLHQE